VYFLNAIFLASALLFYETHAGMFFKELAGRRLQEILPEAARVEMGSVRGGIFKNLIAENIRIYTGETDACLEIEEARINYKLWYPFLQKFPFLARPNGKEKKPSHFRVVKEKGYIDVTVDKKDENLSLAIAKIRHMKFNDMDIVGECEATIETGSEGFVNSRIVIKNVIVNYAPFNCEAEILLSYDRKKGVLHITRFSIGDGIDGCGYVGMPSRDYVSLKCTITNLDLKRYLVSERDSSIASGIIDGKFTLDGPIEEARLLGHLAVREGSVIGLKFDSIIANLKGKLPIISIVDDSRIIKENGHMDLGGTIDLSKLKDKKAFEGIRLGPGENFFAWEGWNVTQAGEKSSVVAEKYLDEDFRLSFRSYTEDKQKQEKQEKHFFGIEHKMKF